MNVLIPENTLLWTTKGFCFPKDVVYGTEIFIIDSNNAVKQHPIIDDLEEPEEYLVYSLIFKNQVSTILPNYKIKNNEKLIEVKSIKENDEVNLFDNTIVEQFVNYQNEHIAESSEASPITAVIAKYLALCKLSAQEDNVEFKKIDEDSASEFNVKIQKDLRELGGVATRRLSLRFSKNFKKNEGYKIFYESKKLYNFRKQMDLKKDKIPNFIYSNGYSIFSIFLREIFNAGFVEHLIFFIRQSGKNNHVILNLPWNSKIRKLLQNTLMFENKYQLYLYENTTHRNLNEVRLDTAGISEVEQKILEIKQHKTKCYEIDIPMGTKMIMDNLIVKPYQISDDEKEELENFEEITDHDFETLRKKIMSEITKFISPFSTIGDINNMAKPFKIHVIGKFDRKGIVKISSTKYGDASKVTGILYDDTGEIKIQLWGEIAEKINDGDYLELDEAYAKNGILNNKRGSYEKIHEI